MEHDDRHLDSLSSSVIEYFNEVLIHKNCVSSTFRKYSVKNNEDVEFSFLLLRSTSDDRKSFYPIDSSCITEEEVKKLVKLSERWGLRLGNASIEGNKVCLKLNRPHAFYSLVKSILSRKSEYGKYFSEKQATVREAEKTIHRVGSEREGNKESWFRGFEDGGLDHGLPGASIKITSEDAGGNDLTGYRLKILRIAALNLLEAGGYEVKDEEGRWIHFTTKNSSGRAETGAKLNVLCGPVINSETKTKENKITVEEYRNLRLKHMEVMSEDKDVDETLLNSLVDGSIKVSLLQVKSSQAVSLNLRRDNGGDVRESGSKGGTFLLYNASRLAALREKYRQLSREGIYPEMGTPEEVNFDLLNEPEEWALLFNFLLEYPSMIYRTSREMASGRSNVHQICDFLLKLCSLFSVYYRRVRILLEPRSHLVPTVQARLLLAMAVEQVLENGFAILNIPKVEKM